MQAAEALAAHDQRILEEIRAGIAAARLRELMQERGERVHALVAALSGAERLSVEETRQVQQRERELHQALARRRDGVAAELARLHRARRAGKTYCGGADRQPRFLDRAG